MKRLLLVPPHSWGNDDMVNLRAALNGTKVELSTGKTTDLIPGNDFVLIILSDEYEPGLLRTIGKGARSHNVELVYAQSPVATIAARIEILSRAGGKS